MNEIDLDLDNYDLNDLLHLFQMPHPFNINDLRAAKKIVLRTHPDKSGLPKEYFLFFAKAFKLLHRLHTQRTECTDYLLEDASAEAALFKPLIESADFNTKFNELFEQHRLQQAGDDGHGHWLQSSDGLSEAVARTPGAIHEYIEQRQQALCVRESVRSVGDDVMSNLDPDTPLHYGATLFSKLAYDDVRRAHTETVVPVMESERPVFANEEALREHRTQTITAPLDEAATARTLRDTREQEERLDIQRAYRLTKQDEEVSRANASWKIDFLRLIDRAPNRPRGEFG